MKKAFHFGKILDLGQELRDYDSLFIAIFVLDFSLPALH